MEEFESILAMQSQVDSASRQPGKRFDIMPTEEFNNLLSEVQEAVKQTDELECESKSDTVGTKSMRSAADSQSNMMT